MKKLITILIVCAFVFSALGSIATAESFPRSWLWDTNALKMVDTSKFKKKPPYVIGFSNASVSNSWRVYFDLQVRAEAEAQKDLIKKFYVTDANDKPDKQIADVPDMAWSNQTAEYGLVMPQNPPQSPRMQADFSAPVCKHMQGYGAPWWLSSRCKSGSQQKQHNTQASLGRQDGVSGQSLPCIPASHAEHLR